MLRSPAVSSAPAGALPSPISAMRPFARATQRCSITRSASTILTLAITVSFGLAFISFPSGRGGEAGDVDDAIGDQMADLVVMDDRDHGDALLLLLGDQLDHHGAVGRVKRGGRLVEQQDRQLRDEAARDVDALLLATGERRGRKLPEPLGDVETMQQAACA